MESIAYITFSIACWLGLYLIARNNHPRLRITGIGLLAYALALGLGITTDGEFWKRINWSVRIFPPVLWAGGIIFIDDRIKLKRSLLTKIWIWAMLPIATVGAVGFALDIKWVSNHWIWFSILIGLSPAVITIFLLQDIVTLLRPRQATGILLAATLFFTLGEGFLVLTINLFPADWAYLAIGLDILFLGLAIAWFDAFEEGETLFYDLLRSFTVTTFTTLVFAGQIGFIIAIQTGLTQDMRILLISTIITAITLSVFADALQSSVDKFVFLHAPALKETRSQLRTESALLPRLDANLKLEDLEEEERIRLTRRALSNYGNLPKLASSPLTKLPLIDERLNQRNAPENTLERANELKGLLTESISRLKPNGPLDFDTSDEWRYYNALYFPYVVGLRPYSRRQGRVLATEEKDALNWMQAFVPERTLYNWQNVGAKLVANDLWEQNFQKNNS